ncbi:MAG TPA: tripartite tricarboxylate transporter substrate binding protein [Burkholderiales bacterium]|nr:tripartite tricarboxylate transporter substrate binding protein [Burkholderiales bacterium]
MPTYPSKPIRIISPLASGGSGDALARSVGETLAEALGQPVVIDNRPGANGIIGVELVVKAAPDGYTLLVASGGNIVINPALYASKLPFNVERDLIPVTQIATQSFIAHVSPGFPATSIKSLIAIAKSKPDPINFASAGAGSTAHLMAVLFESMTGVRMTHVPYKGAAQGRVAVMARECDLMFDGLLAALPLIKAGKLRGLGVTGAKRSNVAPDIPTISESGVPGYSADAWYGMFAPRGTPAPIITELFTVLNQSLRAPERQEKLNAQGVDAVASTPAMFTAFVKAETTKWTKVVRESGVKPD